MDVKKFAVITVTVLLLFFVITQPTTSAGIVHQILGMLQSAAESIITFMSSVFSGA